MTAMAHSSPFYPPRARWYSPVLGTLERVCRVLKLGRSNRKVGSLSFCQSIRRGDNISYKYSGHLDCDSESYVREGTDHAPVIGVPGDKITFKANTYCVNGVPHPRLAYMPQSGECIVPEKKWFIWPVVGVKESRFDGQSRVTGALMQMALVSKDQLIEMPFKR
jgi:hypothetical protein